MRPINRRYGVVAIAFVAVLVSSGALRTISHLCSDLVWSLVPSAFTTSPALSVDSNPAVRQYFDGNGAAQHDNEQQQQLQRSDGEEVLNVDRIFSAAELAQHRGDSGQQTDSDGHVIVMLAVMGKVYDVTSGGKHYGPGGTYSGFAGKCIVA